MEYKQKNDDFFADDDYLTDEDYFEEDDYDLYADDDVTENERVWAMLCWLQIMGVWPLISIIALFLENTRHSAYIRYHAMLSLLLAVVLIPVTILSCGMGALLYLGYFYWALKAYQGEWVHIPVVSNWVRPQVD